MGVKRQNLASKSPVVWENLSPACIAYLLAQRATDAPKLVVAPSDEAAELLAADLRVLTGDEVALLQAGDHTALSEVLGQTQVVYERLAFREQLTCDAEPKMVVASAAALLCRWMPIEQFQAAQTRVRRGDGLGRDHLVAALMQCGYQRVNTVEDEGTFAVRGSVVDVLKPGQKLMMRFDFFGDEVVSIKAGVPGQHGASSELMEALFSPIRDVIFDDMSVLLAQQFVLRQGDADNLPSHKLRMLKEAISHRNYFLGIEGLWPAFYPHTDAVADVLIHEKTLITLVDPEGILAAWQTRHTRAEQDFLQAQIKQRLVAAVAQHYTAVDLLRQRLWQGAGILAMPLALAEYGTPQDHGLVAMTELVDAMAERRLHADKGDILAPLVRYINALLDGQHLLIALQSLGQAMRLRELLLAHRVDLPVLQRMPTLRALQRATSAVRCICVAPLSGGLCDAQRDITVLSDHEIFGAAAIAPKKRRAKKATQDGLNTLKDLREGDLIIHQDHGIGRYDGLVRLVIGGVDGDFARLVYAADDKLYLPVYRLGMLKRYHGSQANARLDKLGGQRWQRAKARVRDAVLTLAHNLLAMQARRVAHQGFAIGGLGSAYAAFTASFPYEETPDQQAAIEATLKDLQKDTPMDRLVCGDVGFGKTEVALRAAFAAAHSGKQVAVLVPTTVLAEQHGQTFAGRMAPFGVVVEVLSRFRTPKESQDVLARLKSGAVDVLIGTHRLLSEDVVFKNLGLMVVDEEQRFGVKHKERLKQLRAHVHVLTLSATPIPRTLYMATSGLKDLSLIRTPPAERSAIRTEILRWDDVVVREAIEREMHRGGQIFVVHNRVQSIENMAQRVRRLAPKAQVLVAHGQMSADVLEAIMVKFVRHEAHVLVCTAIIESGIDIPSANTMIVNRADTFGLSQLYQLRGRIGRGNARAYAYLVLPESEEDGLSKEATQRLALLRRFSDLGAGFMVASHDLEMRGAGDLLGADQSGQIAAVGYELYTELLHEAVQKARGEGPRLDVEPEIKLSVAAVFPESYMPEALDRLAYYQRMAQSAHDEGIYEVLSEVREIFGPPPREALGLVALMILRRRLQALGAHTLTAAYTPEALRVGVAFVPDAPLDRLHLVSLCEREPNIYRMLPSGKLVLTLAPPKAQPPLGSEDPAPLPHDLITAVRHGIETLRAMQR